MAEDQELDPISDEQWNAIRETLKAGILAGEITGGGGGSSPVDAMVKVRRYEEVEMEGQGNGLCLRKVESCNL